MDDNLFGETDVIQVLSHSYRSRRSIPKLMAKISRKRFRSMLKKARRKRIRQLRAKARDEEEHRRLEILQASPSYVRRQAELLALDELQREKDERERERLHQEWLRREAIAELEFRKMKETEEKIRIEKEEHAKKLQQEWELLQKKDREEVELREAALRSKKEKEAALLKQVTDPLSQENGPWHNPTPPPNFGTEKDKQNCPFFIKTGACRFGDRCSRGHPKPNMTCTLLIPGMFTHFSIDQSLRDEFDSDISLEYEDSDFYQHFREFYEDVLPEFKTIGRVIQFKVCHNFEPHLRGNVYVQFEREEKALEAFQKFNGRWYAGKQLSCEFTSVTKWKSAICGLYHRNRCPKGKVCNFLHVFHNPDLFDGDREFSPTRGSEHRSSWHSGTRSPSRSHRSRSPVSSHRSWSSSTSRRSRSPSRSHRSSGSHRSSRHSYSYYTRQESRHYPKRDRSRSSSPESSRSHSHRHSKSSSRRSSSDSSSDSVSEDDLQSPRLRRGHSKTKENGFNKSQDIADFRNNGNGAVEAAEDVSEDTVKLKDDRHKDVNRQRQHTSKHRHSKSKHRKRTSKAKKSKSSSK